MGGIVLLYSQRSKNSLRFFSTHLPCDSDKVICCRITALILFVICFQNLKEGIIAHFKAQRMQSQSAPDVHAAIEKIIRGWAAG